MSERRVGILYMLASAVGFAFLPILTRAIYNLSDLQPTDIAVWRFVFATPIIWLLVNSRRSPHSSDEKLPRLKLMSLGILYAAGALTAFYGLERIPASTYVVLFYTYPAMVALLSVVLGVRLTVYGWLALALTLIGIMFTVPDFNSAAALDPVGVLFALANALSVALYFLASGRVMRQVKALARSSAWVITGTLIVILCTIPFVGGVGVPDNAETWGLLLMFSVVCTAIPIFSINVGIQKIGAAHASIISSIEPAVTMILAIVLLGEVILGVQWLGAVLIIAGVVLLEVPSLRKRNRPRVR